MTSEEKHARALELFRERTALQREIKTRLERIEQIEKIISALADNASTAD